MIDTTTLTALAIDSEENFQYETYSSTEYTFKPTSSSTNDTINDDIISLCNSVANSNDYIGINIALAKDFKLSEKALKAFTFAFESKPFNIINITAGNFGKSTNPKVRKLKDYEGGSIGYGYSLEHIDPEEDVDIGSEILNHQRPQNTMLLTGSSDITAIHYRNAFLIKHFTQNDIHQSDANQLWQMYFERREQILSTFPKHIYGEIGPFTHLTAQGGILFSPDFGLLFSKTLKFLSTKKTTFIPAINLANNSTKESDINRINSLISFLEERKDTLKVSRIFLHLSTKEKPEMSMAIQKLIELATSMKIGAISFDLQLNPEQETAIFDTLTQAPSNIPLIENNHFTQKLQDELNKLHATHISGIEEQAKKIECTPNDSFSSPSALIRSLTTLINKKEQTEKIDLELPAKAGTLIDYQALQQDITNVLSFAKSSFNIKTLDIKLERGIFSFANQTLLLDVLEARSDLNIVATEKENTLDTNTGENKLITDEVKSNSGKTFSQIMEARTAPQEEQTARIAPELSGLKL